jgi:hypothetical protein
LAKERLVGFRVAIGPIPVPVRFTCCGLPPALSVMFMVAERFPLAVGVKVTLKVQLAPTATVVPQSLVCAKSLGFGPAMAILVMTNVDWPVFVSVVVCAALVEPIGGLPKESLFGDRVTVVLELDVPLPVKLAVWGLLKASSETLKDATRVPKAVGVKVTFILH